MSFCYKWLSSENKLEKRKQYGFQLYCTLKIAITQGFGINQYLVDQVVKVHANDRCGPWQHVITYSYNPETGVAYHFTPHSNQFHYEPAFCINQFSNTYDHDSITDQVL